LQPTAIQGKGNNYQNATEVIGELNRKLKQFDAELDSSQERWDTMLAEGGKVRPVTLIQKFEPDKKPFNPPPKASYRPMGVFEHTGKKIS